MTRRAWNIVVAAVLVAACGGSGTTAPDPTPTSPVTVTYQQLMTAQGWTSRSFTVAVAGVVSVTLQTSELPMGIGIGVAGASGSGCQTSVSVVTSAGESPQLSSPVDAGNYCLIVFDVSPSGSRTTQVPVTVVLVHP